VQRYLTRPPLPAAPPKDCAVCEHGCSCTGADVSCGHYGCYGRGPLTCPSAHAARDAYEERLRVTRAQRARLHARRAASSPAWRPPALGLLP
jgi:hypothetical protein